jgi:hypothetical protein
MRCSWRVDCPTLRVSLGEGGGRIVLISCFQELCNPKFFVQVGDVVIEFFEGASWV